MLGVRPSYRTGFSAFPGATEYPQLWRGLIGAWDASLGVTGSKIFDFSGKGHHGAWAVANPWRTVFHGPMWSFNGAGYINCGSNFAFTGAASFTVIVWFNTLYTGGDNYIMGTGGNNGWYMRLESTSPAGCVVVKVDDGVQDASVYNDDAVRYDDGRWHQLAMVWNSVTNTLEGFIDAVSFGTDVQLGVDALLNTLWIGGDPELGVKFVGYISNTLIYTRTLCPAEIRLLWQLRKQLSR